MTSTVPWVYLKEKESTHQHAGLPLLEISHVAPSSRHEPYADPGLVQIEFRAQCSRYRGVPCDVLQQGMDTRHALPTRHLDDVLRSGVRGQQLHTHARLCHRR